jgi:hypothetical protein
MKRAITQLIGLMPPLQPTILIISLLLTSPVFAAQPTSIKHIEDIVTGNTIFSHYVVHCSDGTKHNISAWNERKLWCVDKGRKDKCFKTQISIARYTCKATG